jgi:hypothetical protein
MAASGESRRPRGHTLIGALAEIANVPVTTLLRHRNGIAQLRRIDSDVSPAMMVHDSPSLFEALPVNPGNPRRNIEGESPL